MGTIEIREADTNNIADILRITERSWKSAYSDILSQESIDTAMNDLRESGVTRQLIERETVAFFVAERNDTLVGFISGTPGDEEDVAVLDALYVDPDHWNEGIGTSLLDEFEAFCLHQGNHEIEFHVLSENEIGMSFYRTQGYTVVDTRESDRFGESVRVCLFRGEIEYRE